MRAKLKNKKGFTLTEVLVALLIMSLVTGVVAAGMPSAIRAYRGIVDLSNAQLLLTTTTNTLRNELDLASDISVDARGTTIDFRSTNGTMSRIEFHDEFDSAEDKSARLYEYVGYASDVLGELQDMPDTDQGFNRPLVSAATASHSMYVKVASIVPGNGCVTFNNLTVCKGDTELATVEKFVVKTEN